MVSVGFELVTFRPHVYLFYYPTYASLMTR